MDGHEPGYEIWDIDYRFAEGSGGAGGSRGGTSERLESLEREHNLEPAAEDHYRFAQVWEAAGETQRAMAAAVRYLQLGRRGRSRWRPRRQLVDPPPGPAAAGRARSGNDQGPAGSGFVGVLGGVWAKARGVGGAGFPGCRAARGPLGDRGSHR